MDALAEILRSLRLESGLVSRAHLTGRYAVLSKDSPHTLFHAVVRGQLHFATESFERELVEGDVVVVCRGEPHVLSDAPKRESTWVGDIPTTRAGPIAVMRCGEGDGPPADVVCGYFDLQHEAADQFMSLLPDVIHLSRASVGVTRWIDETVRLLLETLEANAPGLDEAVTRILDAFFIQILRAHFAQGHDESRGWLAALSDPRIAKALALIHGDPATAWTASDLASAAGMSRSSFFARFSELVGEPPLGYVTRWRMLAAADLLSRSSASVAEVAQQVGYGSEHAFARTFRRVVGQTPGAYRREA